MLLPIFYSERTTMRQLLSFPLWIIWALFFLTGLALTLIGLFLSITVEKLIVGEKRVAQFAKSVEQGAHQ